MKQLVIFNVRIIFENIPKDPRFYQIPQFDPYLHFYCEEYICLCDYKIEQFYYFSALTSNQSLNYLIFLIIIYLI